MITDLSAFSDFSLYTSASFSGNIGQNSPMVSVSGQDGLSQQANSANPIEASSQATLPEQTKLQDSKKPKIPGQPDRDSYECETCKNRKYQDGSQDPSVSFKTPTRLSPERAAFAIRAHEAEHVAHARVKAQKEDQEIVSQSVSYRTGVCPECGRIYMAGGTTRTTFRSAPVVEETPVEKGRYVNLSV